MFDTPTIRIVSAFVQGKDEVTVDAVSAHLDHYPQRRGGGIRDIAACLANLGFTRRRSDSSYVWVAPPPKAEGWPDRNWACEGEIAAGDVLIAAAGFSCIEADSRLRVEQGPGDILFVECSDGRHALDGQLDEQGRYVGLFKAEFES